MTTSARKLQAVADLREKLQGQLGLKHQKFLSFSLWESGMPRPGLVEISGSLGSGKTEAVLVFLKEHPELRVVWIEERFNFFPTCLGQHQLSADRFLFIAARKDNADWAFQQVISAQIFDVVILSGVVWNETSLRRAQILSEKNNASVVCLQNESVRKAVWAFDFQLQSIRTSEGLSLRRAGTSVSRSARILSFRGSEE
ncbi:MAG: hypothetical protein K2X47_16465 [Bdellovibrionales bacterium]|nr:hypothetical protein [Bdellovibrionales bacterium]